MFALVLAVAEWLFHTAGGCGAWVLGCCADGWFPSIKGQHLLRRKCLSGEFCAFALVYGCVAVPHRTALERFGANAVYGTPCTHGLPGHRATLGGSLAL